MNDDQRNATLREMGRPHVTAWLEVRQVKTLKHGDAADLMERVGAAIEAERNELQSRLAQVEKERDEMRTQLRVAIPYVNGKRRQLRLLRHVGPYAEGQP